MSVSQARRLTDHSFRPRRPLPRSPTIQIKAENCLLTLDGTRAKLCDLGLSHAYSDTSKDTLCSDAGTIPYQSPEILRIRPAGKEGQRAAPQYAGRPADVWALGVLLFRMVYNRLPFLSQSRIKTKWFILFNRLDFAGAAAGAQDHEARLDFSDDEAQLQNLLRRMIAKDPKKRLTVSEVMQHPWVTKNGSWPFARSEVEYPEVDLRANLSAAEVQHAITGVSIASVTGLKLVMRRMTRDTRERLEIQARQAERSAAAAVSATEMSHKDDGESIPASLRVSGTAVRAGETPECVSPPSPPKPPGLVITPNHSKVWSSGEGVSAGFSRALTMSEPMQPGPWQSKSHSPCFDAATGRESIRRTLPLGRDIIRRALTERSLSTLEQPRVPLVVPKKG